MYSGETNVFEEQIPGLLILAETLGIKGLADLKHKNVQNVNKILKINEDKVQMYQFESKPSDDNRSPNTNAFSRKCIYSNFIPEDEVQNSNFLNNFEQYHNYLSRSQDNGKLQESSINANEVPQGERKILNNINNFNKITDILRCLSSSSIAVSNFANEFSIMKSCSERLPRTIIEKKPEDHINFFEDICVGNNPTTDILSGIIQSNVTVDMTQIKNTLAAEPAKSSSNTKIYATCFICQKQLSNQYNLRVHLETHQNIRYSCSVCPHVSRSKDALRKHVSYRHSGNINSYNIEPKKKRTRLINIAPESTTIPPREFANKSFFNNNENEDDIKKTQENQIKQSNFPSHILSRETKPEMENSLPSKLNIDNFKINLIQAIEKPLNDFKPDSK
ncbi:PR domain zinc finger protein 15 isoform X2 [Condylostylus longicornis]|nr:PR domain zinc finger protein 15 isoform X2 [Condylostylus longicornis]